MNVKGVYYLLRLKLTEKLHQKSKKSQQKEANLELKGRNPEVKVNQKADPFDDLYIDNGGEKVYLSTLLKSPDPDTRLTWLTETFTVNNEFSNFRQRLDELQNSDPKDVLKVLTLSRDLREDYLRAGWKSDALNEALMDAFVLEPEDILLKAKDISPKPDAQVPAPNPSDNTILTPA